MEFKNWLEYIWACAIKHNLSKQIGKLLIHTSLPLFSDFEENINFFYREDEKIISFLQSMQMVKYSKIIIILLVN